MLTVNLTSPTRRVSFEVANLSGLEAWHIVSRWREPPESRKYSDSGLKGRHNRRCAGPSGLRFLILVYRWLTPPALDISALRA